MTEDILIRGIDHEDREWISRSIPAGVSQNEFLQNVITEARESNREPDFFNRGIQPDVVYGNLPFKFIDLFAGIGGFRSALTALGGKCVFTSEWDKYAVKTYQQWFGDNEIYTDDIRGLSANIIPDHDILCAGFPCQPFSLAGVSKKQSLGRAHGFDDVTQGNLFFKIMDIVDAKRPPILFLENVKNLKSHDKGNTWKVIDENIRKREYILFAKVIDARYWVPQHRERVFIVCFDQKIFGTEEDINFTFPEVKPDIPPVLSDILHKAAPDKKYMLSDKLWQYLIDYAEKHRKKGNGFGYSLFRGNDVARTLSARYHKDGSEILINQKRWRNPRRLTPHEAMLLMGFDSKYAKLFGHDEYFPQVVSDTQAYRQFGNSVVPKVVEVVGRNMIDAMANTFIKTNNGCLIKGRRIKAS